MEDTNSFSLLGLVGLLALVAVGVGVWMFISTEKTIPTEDVGNNLTNVETNLTNNQNTMDQNNQVNTETTDKKGTIAVMTTNYGVIELELFADKTPNTVANFMKLAESGFYDGVLFHRVIPGFMIQGGDPLTKSDPTNWAIHGTGGPGYQFADEIAPDNKNNIGTISMANAGPNTNGSQFFINVANNNFLDPKHTVFGKVVSGMEVVKKIEVVEKDGRDHPLEDVKIEKLIIK
jgi:peptidylprolyl isomerase